MAYKYYDRSYINPIYIDNNKINELFGIANQMDCQEILQYSIINKLPLSIATVNGDKLIHNTILNPDKKKN